MKSDTYKRLKKASRESDTAIKAILIDRLIILCLYVLILSAIIIYILLDSKWLLDLLQENNIHISHTELYTYILIVAIILVYLGGIICILPNAAQKNEIKFKNFLEEQIKEDKNRL